MVYNIKGDLETVKQSEAEGEGGLSQPEKAFSLDGPTPAISPFGKGHSSGGPLGVQRGHPRSRARTPSAASGRAGGSATSTLTLVRKRPGRVVMRPPGPGASTLRRHQRQDEYLPKEPVSLFHPGPGAPKALPDAAGPQQPSLALTLIPALGSRRPLSLEDSEGQSCSLSRALKGSSDSAGVAPFVYTGQACRATVHSSCDADLTASSPASCLTPLLFSCPPARAYNQQGWECNKGLVQESSTLLGTQIQNTWICCCSFSEIPQPPTNCKQIQV